MTVNSSLETDVVDSVIEPYRRVLRWVLHYAFWVLTLFSVVAFTWWSASGSSAFRYAGF